MKYKVGDKVRIKSFDWYNENRDKIGQVDCGCGCVYAYFAPSMVTFCGQIVTISSVQTSLEAYRIKEDGGTFKWTDKMIEGLAEEESEKKLSDESWKPSKEEMDVLYGLAYITNQYDEHKEEIITRLYQDLKREFFNGSSYENIFPDTEDDVRRRSTIQVLEYARSLDNYNQYGKEDIDKNIVWLEKQDKKPQGKSAPEAINERNIDSQNYLKPTNKVEPKFRAGESFNLPQGYQFVDENGNVINAQKITLEKKEKMYPKTYGECCEILGVDPHNFLAITNCYEGEVETTDYEKSLSSKFVSLWGLRICRDAYWKIAGEEMGLGKPWEYDCNSEDFTPAIIYRSGCIQKVEVQYRNAMLAFPTLEMRDAFYENFEELIIICKKLL